MCPMHCLYSLVLNDHFLFTHSAPPMCFSTVSFLAISGWGTAAVCLVGELNFTVSEASSHYSSTLVEFSEPGFQRALPGWNHKIPSSLSMGELFVIQGAPQILIMDESRRDAGTMQISIQCAWGGASESEFLTSSWRTSDLLLETKGV